MGILWDLMEFNGDLTEFNGDLIGFKRDFNGITMGSGASSEIWVTMGLPMANHLKVPNPHQKMYFKGYLWDIYEIFMGLYF